MRSPRGEVIEVTIKFPHGFSIGDPINADVEAAIRKRSGATAEAEDASQEQVDDIPIVLDGDGNPTVQGTSLFGSLRAHLDRYTLASNKQMKSTGSRTGESESDSSGGQTSGSVSEVPATLADLFCGSLPEEWSEKDQGSQKDVPKRALKPSALRLVCVTLDNAEVESRTRTAINRDTGAAQGNKLFRRKAVNPNFDSNNEPSKRSAEANPVPTATALFVVDGDVLDAAVTARWPGRSTSETQKAEDDRKQQAQDAIREFVAALRDWQVNIGGLRSAGLGRGSVDSISQGSYDISTDEGLEALLDSDSTINFLQGFLSDSSGAEGAEDFGSSTSRRWVNAPQASADKGWPLIMDFTLVDPLLVDVGEGQEVGAEDNSATAAADGKTPRKVRRSATVIRGTTWKGIFRSRCEYTLRTVGIDVCKSSESTCGRCPTCFLFGWSPAEGLGAEGRKEGTTGDGQRGLIAFLDSPVMRGSQRAKAGLEIPHVAIDRFTGGALPHALYTDHALAPHATVQLRIEALGRDLPDWAGPLLWMAARDIHDGLEGVGNSTTRGYGTLKLVDTSAMDDALGNKADPLENWKCALTNLYKWTDGAAK